MLGLGVRVRVRVRFRGCLGQTNKDELKSLSKKLVRTLGWIFQMLNYIKTMFSL